MEDDWDAEDFVPPAPILAKEQPKNLWDDEDAAAEDEDVKESWEEEENVKPVTAPATQKPKVEKRKVAETKQKESTPEEDAAKELEEKLRQQRLVEEADYQSTTEVFGKRTGDHALDNFIPKSERDFLEYAELLAHELVPFEKSFHYLNFLKAVTRHAMTSLTAADAKEIASILSVLANEKLKAEKEAAGKKKTGTKKKQLHVDKPDEDSVYNAYDDANDYDFI